MLCHCYAFSVQLCGIFLIPFSFITSALWKEETNNLYLRCWLIHYSGINTTGFLLISNSLVKNDRSLLILILVSVGPSSKVWAPGFTQTKMGTRESGAAGVIPTTLPVKCRLVYANMSVNPRPS